MWQDIATAPKDGTEIILFVPGWKKPVVGHWWDEQTFRYGKPDRHRQEWFASGSFFGDPPQPTHWMPFPDTSALSSPNGIKP